MYSIKQTVRSLWLYRWFTYEDGCEVIYFEGKICVGKYVTRGYRMNIKCYLKFSYCKPLGGSRKNVVLWGICNWISYMWAMEKVVHHSCKNIILSRTMGFWILPVILTGELSSRMGCLLLNRFIFRISKITTDNGALLSQTQTAKLLITNLLFEKIILKSAAILLYHRVLC